MTARNREYNFHVCCDWCGHYFDASRSDAKYCSSSCRGKYNRAALKRSQKLERIKRDIDDLLSNSRLEVADMLAREISEYASAYEVRVIG